MSGASGNYPNAFNFFSSKVISPCAFQMKSEEGSKDLLKALDAAVVRTQIDGEVLQAERDNPPFQVRIRVGLLPVKRHKLPATNLSSYVSFSPNK